VFVYISPSLSGLPVAKVCCRRILVWLAILRTLFCSCSHAARKKAPSQNLF